MTLFTGSARRRRRTPVMRAPIGPLTQQSNKVPKNAQTICRICINCWKMESSSNRAQLGDGMMDEDRIRHARPAPTAGASRKRAKLKTIPARPQAGGGREVFFDVGFRVFWPQDAGFNETLSLYTRLPTQPGGCLAQAGGDRPCRRTPLLDAHRPALVTQ